MFLFILKKFIASSSINSLVPFLELISSKNFYLFFFFACIRIQKKEKKRKEKDKIIQKGYPVYIHTSNKCSDVIFLFPFKFAPHPYTSCPLFLFFLCFVPLEKGIVSGDVIVQHLLFPSSQVPFFPVLPYRVTFFVGIYTIIIIYYYHYQYYYYYYYYSQFTITFIIAIIITIIITIIIIV